MKYPFLFLSLLLTLSACVSDLEIPIPDHEPMLVVECYLKADEAPYLYLSRSFGIQDNPETRDLLIPDAKVEVWSEGNLLSTLTYRDTVYDSFDPDQYVTGRYHDPALIIEAGKTYELRVSHPEYPDLRAVAEVPARPIVRDIRLFKDSIQVEFFDIGGFGDTEYNVYRSIVRAVVDDPANQDNYYSFTGVLFYTDPSIMAATDTIEQELYFEQNLVYDPNGNLFGDREPVSDEGFDGQLGNIDLLTQLPDCCFYDENERPDILIHSVELRVRSLEAALNDYLRQLRTQRNSNSVGIESALLPTEPVTIAGNVEGGLGVFAGESSQTYRFAL